MFPELPVLREVSKVVFESLRPYLGIVLLLLLLAGGGAWLLSLGGGSGEPVKIDNSSKSQVLNSTSSATPSAQASTAAIVVDVSGAVNAPGVYGLAEGSRVKEALDAAGGLADAAAAKWVAKNLNLAAKLSDGDKIYIPTQQEIKEASRPLLTPPMSSGVVSSAETETSSTPSSNCSHVNINSASAGTLAECLTGVGPTRADSIVEYRQSHGGFKSIEEIQQVKGIGPATFGKIKDRITVR